MNKICECGCEKEVTKEGNRFISGHNTKGVKRDPISALKRKDTVRERYNVDHIMKLQINKDKVRNSYRESSGCDYPLQNPKILELMRSTYKEKTGFDDWMQNPEVIEKRRFNYYQKTGYYHQSKNPEIKEKKILTSRDHWNHDNPNQSPIIKEKIKSTNQQHFGGPSPYHSERVRAKGRETCKKNNGTEYPSQNPEIYEKAMKNSFLKKKYILPSGKEILLQGYEPHFLDYVFFNNLLQENEIEYKPKRIKYLSEGFEHYYFADFYIPKFNLIIEIKSSYILEKYPYNIFLKIEATKALGHNYIMILDKKYEEFKLLIEGLIQNQIN